MMIYVGKAAKGRTVHAFKRKLTGYMASYKNEAVCGQYLDSIHQHDEAAVTCKDCKAKLHPKPVVRTIKAFGTEVTVTLTLGDETTSSQFAHLDGRDLDVEERYVTVSAAANGRGTLTTSVTTTLPRVAGRP